MTVGRANVPWLLTAYLTWSVDSMLASLFCQENNLEQQRNCIAGQNSVQCCNTKYHGCCGMERRVGNEEESWAWRASSRALTGDEDQVQQGRRQKVQIPDLQTSKNQRADEQIFREPRIWLTTRGFARIGKERRGGTVFSAAVDQSWCGPGGLTSEAE